MSNQTKEKNLHGEKLNNRPIRIDVREVSAGFEFLAGRFVQITVPRMKYREPDSAKKSLSFDMYTA